MAWISASNDTGFYVGPTLNLTGSQMTSTTASLYVWKSLMKTAGWQVAASWNGSSGAFYQDILTGVNALGSNNAWFILSMPNNSRSLHVQTFTGDNWRFKYTSTGFVLTGTLGNIPPGPLVTNTTTSLRVGGGGGGLQVNGEIAFVGGGNNSNPIGFSAINPIGIFGSNSIVQMAAQNTAPYLFYFVHYNKLSTDFISGAFFLDTMESGTYSSLLQDPYLIYCRFWNGSAANKPLHVDSLTLGDQSSGLSGYGMMNNLTASYSQNIYDTLGYGFQAPSPTNTGGDGVGFTIPGYSQGIGQGIYAYALSGTNFNVYDGTVELFPVVCATNNNRFYLNNFRDAGYRGVSSLLRYKPPTIVRLGSRLTIASTGSWVAFGDCALPWFNITVSGAQSGSTYTAKEAHLTSFYMTSSLDWFSAQPLWALGDDNFMTTTTTVLNVTGAVLYRGTLAGQYVYNIGTPPAGASNIVIVKIG